MNGMIKLALVATTSELHVKGEERASRERRQYKEITHFDAILLSHQILVTNCLQQEMDTQHRSDAAECALRHNTHHTRTLHGMQCMLSFLNIPKWTKT